MPDWFEKKKQTREYKHEPFVLFAERIQDSEIQQQLFSLARGHFPRGINLRDNVLSLTGQQIRIDLNECSEQELVQFLKEYIFREEVQQKVPAARAFNLFPLKLSVYLNTFLLDKTLKKYLYDTICLRYKSDPNFRKEVEYEETGNKPIKSIANYNTAEQLMTISALPSNMVKRDIDILDRMMEFCQLYQTKY